MSTEPKFYAVDALDAYPEPVGTDDKLELNLDMGAVYVHLNYKRAKLVGLQSLDFLIRNLELIRTEALGARQAAPVVERQEPSHWADAYDNTITASHKSHNEKLGGAPAMVVERYTQPLYTSPPAPVAVVPDERAAFEKAVVDMAVRFHPDLSKYGIGGEYKHTQLQYAWDLWKARACLDKVKEMNR